MYIVIGLVALLVYASFVVGTYEYLHSGVGIDWLTFVVSFLWPAVIVFVLIMRLITWLATYTEQIVGLAYGD